MSSWTANKKKKKQRATAISAEGINNKHIDMPWKCPKTFTFPHKHIFFYISSSNHSLDLCIFLYFCLCSCFVVLVSNVVCSSSSLLCCILYACTFSSILFMRRVVAAQAPRVWSGGSGENGMFNLIFVDFIEWHASSSRMPSNSWKMKWNGTFARFQFKLMVDKMMVMKQTYTKMAKNFAPNERAHFGHDLIFWHRDDDRPSPTQSSTVPSIIMRRRNENMRCFFFFAFNSLKNLPICPLDVHAFCVSTKFFTIFIPQFYHSSRIESDVKVIRAEDKSFCNKVRECIKHSTYFYFHFLFTLNHSGLLLLLANGWGGGCWPVGRQCRICGCSFQVI